MTIGYVDGQVEDMYEWVYWWSCWRYGRMVIMGGILSIAQNWSHHGYLVVCGEDMRYKVWLLA